MSVVVAVARNGEVVLASDGRATTQNGRIVSDDTHKTASYDDGRFKVGGVGDLATLQTIVDKLTENPTLQTIVDLFAAMVERANCELIACGMETKRRAAILTVDADGAVLRHKHFYACGTGSDVALGALEVLSRDKSLTAKQMAVQAVKAAIKYNNSCGGSIRVV